MFVSTVPDRPFDKRLAGGARDGKQEYRESTGESARNASGSLSSDYCQEGDGKRVFIEDGGRQIPMGEDRSWFAHAMGVGRGGSSNYGKVGENGGNSSSGRVVNEVVSGLPSGQNSEGSVF